MDDIRDGSCPVCRHHEIIESPLLTSVAVGRSPERALALTANKPDWVSAGAQHGQLVAYSCRSCGFTQLFASQPSTVPIDDEHRTRLIVGARSEEPFR